MVSILLFIPSSSSHFSKGLRKISKVLTTIGITVTFIDNPIGLMSRVFASGPRDQGSNQGRVILKTKKNGTW